MNHVYEYRIRRVRRSVAAEPTCINGQPEAIELFRTFTRGETRELFLVALIDSRNAVMGIEIAAVGSANGVSAHPREVFRAAILAHACAIVCAHNHPSGNPEPSQQDEALTRRMLAAGELLGIPMLDHFVITEGGYRSVMHR